MATAVQLIREYFATDGKPPSLDEMRKLTAEDRREMADAIAKERGLKVVTTGKGATDYV